MTAKKEVPLLKDLLANSPQNWGKWGPDDEVGSLNYLTPQEVLERRGAAGRRPCFADSARTSAGRPGGQGTKQPQRVNVIDKGHYLCGKAIEHPGHLEYVDDLMIMYLQGSTQYDALGHVWYGDQLYNGYDARTTLRGHDQSQRDALAERGVVGRGVLLDMARHRGKAVLDPGDAADEDLLARREKTGRDD